MSEPLLDSAVNPQAYDITKVNPNLYSRHIKLTSDEPYTSGYIQQIELFIPTSYYRSTYKSLVHFRRSDLPAITTNYIKLLELFGFIACAVFEREFDLDNGGTKKTRRVHLELVREHDDIYNEALTDVIRQHWSQENAELDRSLGVEHPLEDILIELESLMNEDPVGVMSKIKDIVYSNEFQSKRKKLNVVGLRLRISLLSNSFSFAGILNTIMMQNEYTESLEVRKKDTFDRKRKKDVRPPLLHTTLTLAEYANLCCFYTADSSIDTNNPHCHKNIWEEDNPLNPLHVFSIERSMEMAKKALADPLSYNINFYKLRNSENPQVIETPKFPFKQNKSKSKKKKNGAGAGAGSYEDGEDNKENEAPVEEEVDFNPEAKEEDDPKIYFNLNFTIAKYLFFHDVFELECKVINPSSIANYILPHKSILLNTNERDIEAYINSHTGEPNSDSERDRKRIIEAYQKTITCSIDDFKAADFDQLAHNCGLVKIELKRRCGEDLSMYGSLWKEARSVLFQQFMQIFSSTGNCGKAVKAIAQYGEDYIMQNKHMCLPFPKLSTNLTFFEDLLVVRATQQEVHEQTNSSHIEGESQMVKMLHVYFGYALNPNVMHIGAGDTGKSHMVDRTLKELIPGSYKKVSFMSAQALIIDGNHMDMMLLVLDDAPPVMIGASSKDKHDPEADKRAAFLKAMLTDGKLTYLAKRTDENGNQMQDDRTARLRVHMTVLANDPKPNQDTDEASQSRFLKSDSEVPKRSDGLNTVNKNQITPTHEMAIAKLKKYIRMQRTQYLIAMIGLLVHCGLMNLDMSGARILNDQILSKAKQKNLPGTEKPRNYHFVECIERVFTVWKAVHTCFDSYDSEFLKYDAEYDAFKFTDWKPEHIFAAEKYLTCTKELVSLSMGFVEKQFETPAAQRIKERLFIESTLTHRNKIQTPYNSPVYNVSDQANNGNSVLRNTTSSSNNTNQHASNNKNSNPFISKNVQLGIDRPATIVNTTSNTNYVAVDTSSDSNSAENIEKMLPHEDREENGYMRIWFLPDSSIDEAWKRERHAAKYLQDVISPAMSLTAINNALKIVKGSMVPISMDDESSDKIPALKFGINCWKVAMSVFLIPCKNVLHSCVQETLNYKGSVAQDMLYGKANETALHIYKLTQVRPTDSCQPLVYREHSYEDEEQMNISTVGLDSVKLSIGRTGSDLIQSIIESREMYNEDVPENGPEYDNDEVDYSSGRSKYAYTEVNSDIDEITITNHAIRCVTHQLELAGVGPHVNPVEHAKFLLEFMTRTDSPIIVYPVGLKLFSDNNYIANLHRKKCLSTDNLLSQQQVIRQFYSNNNKHKEMYNEIMKKYESCKESNTRKIGYFKNLNKSINRNTNVFTRSLSAPMSYGPSSSTGQMVSQFSAVPKPPRVNNTSSSSSSSSSSKPASSTLSQLVHLSHGHKRQKNNIDDEDDDLYQDFEYLGNAQNTSSSSVINDNNNNTTPSKIIPPVIPSQTSDNEEEEDDSLLLRQLVEHSIDVDGMDLSDSHDNKQDSPLATSSSQSGDSPKVIRHLPAFENHAQTKAFNNSSFIVSRVQAANMDANKSNSNKHQTPVDTSHDDDDTLDIFNSPFNAANK